MQQQVWKFPFISDKALFTKWLDIEMPIDAKVLTVASQNGILTLWAQVTPGAPRSVRRFKVYDTGEPIDDYIVHNYIGTVVFPGGLLVLHVYEVFPR